MALVLPGDAASKALDADADTDAVVAPTPLLVRYARWLLAYPASPWLCVLFEVTRAALYQADQLTLDTAEKSTLAWVDEIVGSVGSYRGFLLCR